MIRRLTPVERIIAWRISSGRLVSPSELAEAVYGYDDDCSLIIRGNIRHCVWRINKSLHGTGLAIDTFYGQGYWINPDHTVLFRDMLAQEIDRNVIVPYEPRISRHLTAAE